MTWGATDPVVSADATAIPSWGQNDPVHGDEQSPSMTTGVGRAIATGAPIIGGLLNRADAATNAALAPYVDPLLPDSYDKLPEKTFGERYEHALRSQEGMDRKFGEEHPVVEAASEIAGGIGSTAGVGATATGAKLLGLTGKTLPQAIKAGAISGAGVGTVDAAVRGEDPLIEGGIGAVAGGIAPPLGRLASEAVSPFVRTVRGLRDPEAEAARRVGSAIDRDVASGQDVLSPREFAGAQDAGQPVKILDLGGSTTRALARSAANTSPEARAALEDTVQGRFTTQGDRLTSWLNTTFNYYPDAPAQKEALESVARTVNRPAYARAYSEGAHGIWDENFEQISQAPVVQDAIRKAMVSAKDEAARTGFMPPKNPFQFDQDGRLTLKEDANGNRMLPSLQFWDKVKINLDKVGTREGQDWSRILRGQLDGEVPSYADARAGAAKFFGAQDALEAGQQAVTSRLSNREMASGLSKMSPAERKLFQDGFVDRYVQTIREAPDRANVLNQIGASTASRQRLNMALGPDRTAELEAMLRVENIMNQGRAAVTGNSTTMRQLADLGLAGAVNVYEGGGHPTADPKALMNTLLTYAAVRGSRVAGKSIDERVVRQVAKLLTSDDPAKIGRGIRAVAKNKTMMTAIQNGDGVIASILARGSSGPASGMIEGPRGAVQ